MTNWRLNQSLQARGLTLEVLARLAGVGRSHLSQMFGGTRTGRDTREKVLPFLTDAEVTLLGWQDDLAAWRALEGARARWRVRRVHFALSEAGGRPGELKRASRSPAEPAGRDATHAKGQRGSVPCSTGNKVAGGTDRDIRCQNCHKLFDVLTAECGNRTAPNTLTNLPDHNEAWAKCPHCGFVTEERED